jgi:hypothetical protein
MLLWILSHVDRGVKSFGFERDTKERKEKK